MKFRIDKWIKIDIELELKIWLKKIGIKKNNSSQKKYYNFNDWFFECSLNATFERTQNCDN